MLSLPAAGQVSDSHHSDTGHKHRRHCWAVARSGIPPTSPLFNGSICRYSGPFGGITFGLGAADVSNQLEVSCAACLVWVLGRAPSLA